ncbi:MAG: hypothetical protein Q4C70_13345 [Planctomycetia bacterium]|nr:hypothetical protein [Planctomycetia bacterium]
MKSPMKYPIFDENSPNPWNEPVDHHCPVCGTDMHETGKLFFEFQGDLHLPNGDTFTGVPDQLHYETNWKLTFHGNEKDDDSPMSYIYFPFHIVENYWHNIEFAFCSVACLRAWLNRILDDFQNTLDAEVQKETNSEIARTQATAELQAYADTLWSMEKKEDKQEDEE